MSLISGLSNAIASVKIPEKVQRGFLATSKDGPASVALPEAAVIVGRSEAAARRGGFLEFQERGPEEVASAAIWFWGVSVLQKVFDKLKPMLFKSANHLSGDIAWDKPGTKLPHVDLTPQERFTRDAKEVRQLLKIKGLRWVFSLGVAVWAAGWLLPKLNQWKTNLILKKFYNGNPAAAHQTPPTQATSGGEQADARSASSKASSTTSPAAALPSTFQIPQAPYPPHTLPLTYPPAPFLPTMPAYQPHAPGWPPVSMPPPAHMPMGYFPAGTPQYDPMAYASPAGTPRFAGFRASASDAHQLPETRSGLLKNHTRNAESGSQPVRFGAGITSLLQGVGHAVDQTAYGHMLAVDAAITGGRGWVASKRSVFESIELVFRDAVSLYFYILFAPHVMKGLASVIDPLFKTSMQLEPKVAQGIHQKLSEAVQSRSLHDPALKAALAAGEVPQSVLKEIILGSPREELQQPIGLLKSHLRRADLGQGFDHLLDLETRIHFADSARQKELTDAVKAFLSERRQFTTPNGTMAHRAHLNTGDIHELLQALKKGQGAFQKLADHERANLGVSIKQAFRHTAGLSLNLSPKALGQHPMFADLLKPLSKAEQKALLERINRLAKLDALDQANTMIRRTLNVLRPALTEAGALEAFERKEAIAGWIDRAVNTRMSMTEMLTQELHGIQDGLRTLKLPANVQNLLGKPGDMPTAKALQELENVLGQQSSRASKKVLAQVQDLNRLLGAPQSNSRALGTLARNNLLKQLDDLLATAAPHAPSESMSLAQQYRKMVQERLVGNQGRLFSLAIADSEMALEQKAREILLGGIKNDSTLLRQSQTVVGRFKPDSKLYNSADKMNQMQKGIQNYLDKLLNHVSDAATQAGTGNRLTQWEKTLGRFYRLNQNTHYLSRSIAVGGAMLALGWLVPKLQYALTKRLTGKDVNPGIASAESASGIQRGESSKPAGAAPSQASLPSQQGSSLARSHFQQFKRA